MTGRYLLRAFGAALGRATAAILSPMIANAAPDHVTITPSVLRGGAGFGGLLFNAFDERNSLLTSTVVAVVAAAIT
ncbi:hypothetical protein [Gordonia lacunae]|nr:hypothetical protein [Gordonia lacunae]